MELYDPIITKAKDLLGGTQPKHYTYNPDRAWDDYGSNQLVMMRDAAYELGGSGKTSVNYSCITSGDLPLGEPGVDEVIVYGADLREIRGDVPFARIAMIKVGRLEGEGEDDTEPLFRAINDIDFVKYHVYPRGYMVRTSADSYREQVRLDKAAVARGITFEQVGNLYIKNYKKNPNVEEVKLVFVTAPDANYAELLKDARKVHDITRTLSKILEGMSTDCNTCSLKTICDEVEGLKELHFGKEKKEFK